MNKWTNYTVMFWATYKILIELPQNDADSFWLCVEDMRDLAADNQYSNHYSQHDFTLETIQTLGLKIAEHHWKTSKNYPTTGVWKRENTLELLD